MRVAVFTQLDHDPASAQFVGHSSGRAGSSEGVKNPIAGLCGDLNNSLKQLFWFWSLKRLV
jgi:hypothetical protein